MPEYTVAGKTIKFPYTKKGKLRMKHLIAKLKKRKKKKSSVYGTQSLGSHGGGGEEGSGSEG